MAFKLAVTFGYLVTNVIILLLFVSNVSVSAETFLIVPTANTPCPQDGVPCMTLSQFANTLHENHIPNTSLVLLPGNHTLDSNLTSTDLISLLIVANDTEDQSVIVTCVNEASFSFQDIEEVQIFGVTFYSCVVEIEFVGQLLFKQGQLESNSKLSLTFVNVATITRSQFTMNSAQSRNESDSVTQGGALFISNSNVSIVSSLFSENSADYGGSVYIFNSSVALFTSNFSNNVATYSGGAVRAVRGSYIVNNNCSFTNNSIEEGHSFLELSGGGGAVSVISSTILINNGSEFINNVAQSSQNTTDGGALFAALNSALVVSNSVFVKNVASGSGGAVMVGYYSVAEIRNSLFVQNTASTVVQYFPLISGGGAFGLLLFSNALIDNCMFESNTGGSGAAIGIGESVSNVSSSTFLNNYAILSGGAIANFRGSYTYFNCTFEKNKAVLSSGSALLCWDCFAGTEISLCTFNNNTANNYGGALGIFCSNSSFTPCSSTIENCNFTNNSGPSGFDGAAVSAFSGNLIVKGDVIFEGNNAGVFLLLASNVLFTGNTNLSKNFQTPLFALNSNITFEGNVAIFDNSYVRELGNGALLYFGTFYGGMLSLFESRITFSGSTVISSNNAIVGGAIFAVQSKIDILGELSITNNSVSKSGGGIFAYQSDIANFGVVNIVENSAQDNGGGMYAFSSRINLFARSFYVARNKADKGGGLYLESDAILYVNKLEPECSKDLLPRENICQTDETKWLRLEFADNFAVFGGGMYVNDDTASASVCEAQYGECFFQVKFYYDPSTFYDLLPVITKRQLFNLRNIYFTNNFATKAGNSLYGGLLDRCDLNLFSEVFLGALVQYDLAEVNVDPVQHFYTTTNAQVQDVSSKPLRVCFCKDDKPNCGYKPPPLSIRNGESLNLSLVAVDQINNTVRSSIEIVSNGNITVGRDQGVQRSGLNCTELKYTVFSPLGTDHVTVGLYAQGPCRDRGVSASTIEIQFLSCPIGFVETDSGCICDPLLQDRDYVINCSIDSQSVLLANNVWISYDDNTTSIGEYLVSPSCPLDYCVSENIDVNLNIPNGADIQCAFSRSGILCGRCNNGTNNLSSVLGSSRCLECSDSWLALILLFAIAGIALVAVILVCNLTVAVGTINGLIFYANIVGPNGEALFFPPNAKKNILTVFIAWLNLDIGIETCFYDGMDQYAKAWLQLVFPAYIITLVVLIILVCECSMRFSKLISKKNPVATLATLLLISYAKLLVSIIDGLVRHEVQYLSTDSEPVTYLVWGVDGNVPYLQGKHIFLFIAVMFIAIAVLLYTLLLLFWQGLLHCSNRYLLKWVSHPKISSFMDAYHAPFKARHRYWPGLLLLARIILFALISNHVSSSNGRDVVLLFVAITAGVLLLITNLTGGGIYKKWLLNALEYSFLFNLLLFAIMTAYIRVLNVEIERRKYYQYVLANLSISLAFATFIGICVYHSFVFVLPDTLQLLIKSCLARFRVKEKSKEEPTNVEIRPDNDLRSPLDLMDSLLEDARDNIQVKNFAVQVENGRRKVTHTVVDRIPSESELMGNLENSEASTEI